VLTFSEVLRFINGQELQNQAKTKSISSKRMVKLVMAPCPFYAHQSEPAKKKVGWRESALK